MPTKKVSFTPKARLIKILGEHLIKDATVGLLELVKNSYDADSTFCEIQMFSLNKHDARIIIRDNGSGMDLETFLKKWMNPATGHKEEQKQNHIRSKLGRLPLGEKGVGRFAAQQIGNKLKLISKSISSPQELVVDIDWKKFENNKLDLIDVDVEYRLQSPIYFKEFDDTGVILEISDLKYQWTEQNIKNISGALKRMKSPFKNINDFEIKLQFTDCLPEYTLYENLELSDILNKAHYKLYGIVDKSGMFDFEYESNLPGQEKQSRNAAINLREFGNVAGEDNPFQCGGFIINFYHYNKTLDKKSGFVKRDIDELSGVSVFRDGIRILPYGEKGNDWLGLDSQRIQDTSFIGNDTIIGLIEIDQLENSTLIDKANREGLIENKAYHHFVSLVFACVDLLYKEKLKDRPVTQKKEEKEKKDISDKFHGIKKNLDNTAEEITKDNPDMEDVVIKNLNFAKESITDLQNQFNETVDDLETSNKRLFHLAGTGLAAERFTHEFSRLVSGANESLVRLRNLIDIKNPKIKKEVDIIYGALEALRNDIRLLGPVFYIKKVAHEKDLELNEIISNSLLLMENSLNKSGIKTEIVGTSFKTRMREGSCMQIFVNLIDNSTYWLSKKSETDKRKIRIIIDSKVNSVYVSDNGPGVVVRYRDKIFEPFFSMKGETGRGLGLYIAKEILEEIKGDIFLVSKDDHQDLLEGASFKIVFSHHENEL
jgi:signal transduction histidine kinase